MAFITSAKEEGAELLTGDVGDAVVGRRQHAPPGQRPHVRPGRGDRHQQSEDGHARGGRYRGPAGLKALETMTAIFVGCKMKNLIWKAAPRSFSAGKIAMMYWSTSALGAFERAKGDLELKTYEFPGLKGWPKGLPAGGKAGPTHETSFGETPI